MNRFKLAWQKTVDEVDILRTRIVHLESGTFVQVVVKPEPISWKTAEKLEDVEAVMLPIHNGAELTQFTSTLFPKLDVLAIINIFQY